MERYYGIFGNMISTCVIFTSNLRFKLTLIILVVMHDLAYFFNCTAGRTTFHKEK